MSHTAVKTFSKYVSLNITGMIALSCYILADTFFVARGLGPDGLTALNLAIPVYSFIHGAGLMAGMGGSTRYSILKAGNHTFDADRVFSHTLVLGVFLAVIFMLIGGFFSDALTVLLGADTAVYDMTHSYLKVLLLFSPAFIFNNIMICFVRNDGSPGLSMAAMAIGSFSNIFFDYIFIFPCKMGILGAVTATGFAPVSGLLILSRHFVHRNKMGEHIFHPVRISPSARSLADICSLGASSLVTEIASGIVIIVFNLIILSLSGNIGVAAYGIIANLSLVVTSIFTGIAEGIQPIISNAYGRGSRKDILMFFRYGLILSTALAVVIYLVLAAFHQPVIAAFNETGNLQLAAIAKRGIFLYFTAFPFLGLNIICSAMFSASDHPVMGFALSIMRGLAVIVPCVVILSMMAGMTGVWLAFPVAEGITALGAGWMLWRFFGDGGF